MKIIPGFCILLLFVPLISIAQETKKITTTVTTTTETEVISNDSTSANLNPSSTASETSLQLAEDDESEKWAGLHAGGLMMATFTDFDIKAKGSSISTSYVVGYGGGGFLGYFFNEHAEIRLEILYSSMAQKIKVNERERTLDLTYLNFPFMFAYHTSYNRAVSFNLTAGPQVGINTSSDLDGEGENGIDSIQFALNVKPTDIGVAFGAGIDFGIGESRLTHLNIGFRGVQGLIDISDDNNTTTTNNYYIIDRSRLRTYSLYAGLSYKF